MFGRFVCRQLNLRIRNFNRPLYNFNRNINRVISVKTCHIVTSKAASLSPRFYSEKSQINALPVTEVLFERVCDETLESLYEFFDQIVQETEHLSEISDVNFGSGVLTVHLGDAHGTYVINRQSPNRQIWLSSPISGPKRYDFVPTNESTGYWIYRHDNVKLHQLLTKEISEICKRPIDFFQCTHSN